MKKYKSVFLFCFTIYTFFFNLKEQTLKYENFKKWRPVKPRKLKQETLVRFSISYKTRLHIQSD